MTEPQKPTPLPVTPGSGVRRRPEPPPEPELPPVSRTPSWFEIIILLLFIAFVWFLKQGQP